MFIERDDRERQRLIIETLTTRINTREASTLVFSTVAASASLLILALVYQENDLPYWMKWIGFLFSFLGPAYREITILTSDRIDYRELRARLRARLPGPHWFWIITRGLIIRFFLFLPIAAWLIFFTSSACSWTTIIFTFIVAVLLSAVEFLSRDP